MSAKLAEFTDAPQFTDTHCHFDFPPFCGAEDDALRIATQAGVERIIVPAVTADRFDGILLLAKKYPPVFAALGLHPLYIAQHHEADLELLGHHLRHRNNKLVAVGEIGLDLLMGEPMFERQQSLLEAQFVLAKEVNLPVILHSRRSHDQLAAMLRKAKLSATGVVHGFAGSLSQAEAFVRLGYAIGVGGTISYQRAQKTRNVVAQLPLSSLLLETDAPDMPLQGFQGQPNKPERAAMVFDILCELRSESPLVIAQALADNTRRVFNLPLIVV